MTKAKTAKVATTKTKLKQAESIKESYPVVSSNTLFHFVKERRFLEDILWNEFRARYCYEDLTCLTPERVKNLGPIRDFAIPMKCFCDIPLSLTARHLNTYGPYGIGMTKEWGMQNGLNPILYVHPDSWLRKDIEKAIAVTGDLTFDVQAGHLKINEDRPIDADGLSEAFDYLLFFTKPYKGPFTRDGKTTEVRFYDEREWRFVPKKSNGSNWRKHIHGHEWNQIDNGAKENFNRSVYEDYDVALRFTPNDVRYIIVGSEDELIEFTQLIDKIKVKYSTNDKEVLKTRLISVEQIKSDF